MAKPTGMGFHLTSKSGKKWHKEVAKLQKAKDFLGYCSRCRLKRLCPMDDIAKCRCLFCGRPVSVPPAVREVWARRGVSLTQQRKILRDRLPTPPPKPPRSQAPKSRHKATTQVTYHDYIRSPEWARKKEHKFAEVGRRCERCGHTSGIQVHHRTYDRLGRERLSDLEVLCGGCHEGTHDIDIRARSHLDAISRE